MAKISDKTISVKALLKNKYAIIILAAGLILLLIPSGKKQVSVAKTESDTALFSLTEQERRLESQLQKIEDAGRVSVLLSVDGGGWRQLAESGEETLVLSEDSGEQVVDLHYVNPTYKGAVVVCDGAGSPQVRLSIAKAVSVFTGLGTDKISIIKMNGE